MVSPLQSFIFFGFMVAGEEIESEQCRYSLSAQLKTCQFKDPFGYDKNDLNLDHFTHNIISKFPVLAIFCPNN
jgi:putative membrane protein